MIRRLALVCALSLFAATAFAAEPTPQEKAQALSVLVRLHNAKPAGSAGQKGMATAILMVVFDLAGIEPGAQPTPEQQKALAATLADLKKQGVDVDGVVKGLLGEFEAFACKSKQSEAKGNLKALYVAEESHRAEFDTYEKDQAKVGFAPRAATVRYTYEVVSTSKTAFKARATGTGEMKGDVWEISEKNDLVNVSDVCAPKK